MSFTCYVAFMPSAEWPMQHAFCNMWYGKEESAMSLPPQASFSDILSSLQKRQFGVALKGSKDRRAWRSPCTCQAHIHTPHICQEADLAGFTASSDTGKDDDIRLLALHRAQGTFSKTTLHLTNITAHSMQCLRQPSGSTLGQSSAIARHCQLGGMKV